MRRLHGKVAIVTGAGHGLGRVTAEFFASEGAAVVAADVNFETVTAVANEIHAGGGDALAVCVDVADRQAVESMVARALDRYGRLDILVNNAAIAPVGRNVMDIDEESWDRAMAVNLKGPFLCSKYALAAMRELGSGSIVNVASVSGVLANEHQAEYNASKHGLIGLTRCIAQDCGPFGIRANAVCPTAMDTPMMAVQPRDEVAPYAAMTVFARFARPIEVARAILFLASDEASYLTGAVLMVDGGATAMQASARQLRTGIERFLDGTS